jgi:hypothetical protein
MSDSTSKNTDSAKSLEKNFTLARRFLARQEEIWKLEKDLKKLHEAQKEALAAHPFLGNIVGTLRKTSGSKPAAESKKRKVDEDADMAEVASVFSSSSTARERIAKKLAQDRPIVAAAEKASSFEKLKSAAQDKF